MKHPLFVLVLLLASASASTSTPAHADRAPAPPEPVQEQAPEEEYEEEAEWTFNLCGVIGGGWVYPASVPTGAFSIGFRPELFFPKKEMWPGLGVYLEVGSAGGLYYGSGLTLTIRLLDGVHVAPSVGVAGWEYGITQFSGVAGLFLGLRSHNTISAFDSSIGLRFEGRYGADDGLWGFTIQFQMDLTIIAAIFAFVLNG